MPCERAGSVLQDKLCYYGEQHTLGIRYFGILIVVIVVVVVHCLL